MTAVITAVVIVAIKDDQHVGKTPGHGTIPTG